MISRFNKIVTQLALAAALTLSAISCVQSNLSNPCASTALLAPVTAAVRIDFYKQKLAENPRLYALYPKLASAYIEQTKLTQNPAWLLEAQRALDQSLQIQANFESYKVKAELAAFRHRFDEALQWGEKARQTLPADTSVQALLVESYVNKGQTDAASKLLSANATQDFYQSVAQGHWNSAKQKHQLAVLAFQKAADIAHIQRADSLVAWASLRAADASLDASKLAQAQRFLVRAERVAPNDKQVRISWARWYEAKSDWKKALRIYAAAAQQWDDPVAHQGAYRSASQLQRTAQAQRHFAAAQTRYQQTLQAGEVYQLGALAQLYCDANQHLTQAHTLALRNLQYVNNADAIATLRCIEQKSNVPMNVAANLR